jgi:hypothetical protein
MWQKLHVSNKLCDEQVKNATFEAIVTRFKRTCDDHVKNAAYAA